MTLMLDKPSRSPGQAAGEPSASDPPVAPCHHRSLPRGATGTTFTPAPMVRCRCWLAPPQHRMDCPRCHGIRYVPAGRDTEMTGASDLDFYTNNPIHKETGMPLPTTKTTREGRDPRDARILLVAPPKTGKTTLAAAWAPDTTLLLDTHQGTRLLDGEHYVQPVHSFAEFEQAVDLVAAGDHKFRTVVIDLVEDVYKFAEAAAGGQFGKIAAGLVEYGKGTTLAEAMFRQTVDKLLAAPVGVWFLSHVETIQDGNRITYVPKIDKKVRTYVEGATDFCLLAEANGPNRQLHTAPSARYQIGSRVALPNPMPLDARALYVEIAKGLGKPKPSTTSSTSNGAPAAQEPIAA